ncbi:MAG TPA: GntR family transcriptional regulator [Caldimonas sp.]
MDKETLPAAESAYRAIRAAILRGEFASGRALVEKELGAWLGVSRTPVREALARLANHGLVVAGHYQRGYVAHFSVEDFQEILRLRSVLEGLAARTAATTMCAGDLDRLAALQDEMERMYAELGFERYQEHFDRLNTEFHQLIAQAAGSRRLTQILENALELPALHLSKYSEENELRMARTHWQHREIIAALKSRNPEWAEAQMAAHLISLVLPPHLNSTEAPDDRSRP